MSYSEETRIHVIKYYKVHMNRAPIKILINEIKNIFGISERTFFNWKKSIESKKIGRPIESGKITKDIEKYVINRFTSQNKPSITNAKKRIKKNFNIKISKSSIYKILHDNKITYKKVSINRYPYSDEKLKLEKERVIAGIVDKKKNKIKKDVISLDEFSISLDDQSKKYLWAPSNERAHLKINGNKARQTKSVIMATSNKQVICYKSISGSFKSGDFNDFIFEDVLKRVNNVTLFMDNLSTHKNKEFTKKIKNTNNNVVYNVAYNPEFNPIENCISVVKNYIRNKSSCDMKELEGLLPRAIKKLKPKMISNFFKNSYNALIN